MSRFFFRGIYFPQKGAWSWFKLVVRNRRAISRVVKDCFTQWHGARGAAESLPLGSPLGQAAEERASGD
jgi:hypothetical protein